MNIPLTAQDLTGQVLGDYSLLRRLGRGGMADVYLARQTSLNRNVALKILKPELALDESYVQRFHREAQAAAALVQANIVQIFEVGNFNGLHFIAQEYVHGRNLRQYIDRYGAVEPVMAVNVLRQCAAALQRAAEFDVVHRDIKPENIMLSTSGEVKVTDFGLARINNDSSRQALTQIGITMGTPLYMSPEQVEGRALDSRSDIYSLGVTAYHTLAGQPPFEGVNALAIALQQVQEKAQPLELIRPDVPVELCQLIHRMISKEPSDRPQDPAGLLKEIRKIKIDVDEDWDLLISRLATSEANFSAHSATLSESRLAATQQLQAVLKGNVRSWWGNRWVWGSLASLCLISLIVGITVAQRTVPPFPLNVAKPVSLKIPKQTSVEKQFRSAYWGTYALGLEDESTKIEYWKAVLEYFPLDEAQNENLNETRFYHCLAQTRLGEVYLATAIALSSTEPRSGQTRSDEGKPIQEKLEAALAIYESLEKSPELSDSFRVIGYAGQAIVFDLSAEIAGGSAIQDIKIRQYLGKIGDNSEMLNQFMRGAIENIRKRYPANTQYNYDRLTLGLV